MEDETEAEVTSAPLNTCNLNGHCVTHRTHIASVISVLQAASNRLRLSQVKGTLLWLLPTKQLLPCPIIVPASVSFTDSTFIRVMKV